MRAQVWYVQHEDIIIVIEPEDSINIILKGRGPCIWLGEL